MLPLRVDSARAIFATAVLLAAVISGHAQQGETEATEIEFPESSRGWTLVSSIRHAPLKEASGFALSRTRPGTLWTHNDGGAGSNLFAIDIATGAVLKTVRVLDAPNLDWEDAMMITRAGQHYVGIADIGDNERRRGDCVIHLFEEKSATDEGAPNLKFSGSVRFRYPDGKRHDAESAAFDSRDGVFLVLTKSKMETLVFEIPFPEKGVPSKTVEARSLAALAKPAAYPNSGVLIDLKRGIFGVSATAADVAPDGGALAVMTYTECLLYRRGMDEKWPAAVKRPPFVLPLPAVFQAEALCFSRDGSELFVTSENTPSPLYRIAVPPEVSTSP